MSDLAGATKRFKGIFGRSVTTRSLWMIAALALSFGLVLPQVNSVSASHNIVITVDSDGPDDVPAQTDVSLLGFDNSHLPDYYFVQMQFDDTAYPGGNSVDGCIFFDSDDAGGFSDFAVCGSFIQNTTTGVVELQSAALYDCTGSEPNNDEGKRCRFIGGGGDGSRGIIAQDLDGDGVFESDGNGSPLGTPYDTTCSLTSSASDPFNGVGNHNTIGEQDPITDTHLTCTYTPTNWSNSTATCPAALSSPTHARSRLPTLVRNPKTAWSLLDPDSCRS